MQNTISGDVSQTTIDDLDPNTAYDVQMSANTKTGASPLSEVISAPVPPDAGITVVYSMSTLSNSVITFFLIHFIVRYYHNFPLCKA